MSEQKPGKEDGLVNVAMWLVGITAAIGVLVWAGVVLIGIISFLPWGLVGLVGFAGLAIMIFVVIRDRITSREDDYYSKNVDQ